nr:MAG TPA: hypothetical protein [Caudoviricetes sp.]
MRTKTYGANLLHRKNFKGGDSYSGTIMHTMIIPQRLYFVK